jgi:uncharacterized membrane protein
MITPRQLSQQLRTMQTEHLQRRRWLVGLSLVGTAMGGIVALYQMGIVRRLPDPPIPLFDSSRVDASDYAYKRLETPDAFMMIANYAITAWLAGAGGKDRDVQRPALPIALLTKVALDALITLQLTREEWAENKALCTYCQVATLASLASLPLAWPEAHSAINALRGEPERQSVGEPVSR